MSILKTEDKNKWINAFIAVSSILAAYVSITFFKLLSEWFDLEAKVPNFLVLAQGLGILLGMATFVLVIKNSKAMTFLEEVYAELVKVTWPDKDSITKSTIGIIIGVAILAGLFVLVDFIVQKLLSLVY
jgi:preprotein translocase subunit SecE